MTGALRRVSVVDELTALLISNEASTPVATASQHGTVSAT